MKTWGISLVIAGVAVVSAAAGYWFGFRQAWEMGLMTEAAPRGVVALGNMRAIDAGRIDEVKFSLEGEVDAGLMWWHEIASSPLLPILNELAGSEVYPATEKYVRRLAEYRKVNPSPYWDPALNAQLDVNISKADPELAKEMAESAEAGKEAIEAVIAEYAP